MTIMFMTATWYRLIKHGRRSIGSFDSFDAAQIAALEYCLKERTTQCTED